MKLNVEFLNERIKITGNLLTACYFIEKHPLNNKYYITSDNGYNGFEGEGNKSFEAAISHVKRLMKEDGIQ